LIGALGIVTPLVIEKLTRGQVLVAPGRELDRIAERAAALLLAYGRRNWGLGFQPGGAHEKAHGYEEDVYEKFCRSPYMTSSKQR
jgi:hypothetical protein